jgi:energy-coupling factor transporter transmembrane protein EcfT
VVVVQWRAAAAPGPANQAVRSSFLKRLSVPLRATLQLFAPQNAQDPLWWLAVLPLLITLVFGLSGFVELSSPWAIPLVVAYPLLWVRAIKPVVVDRLAQGFQRWAWLWLLLPLLSAVPLWHDVQSGIDGPTPPRAAAAERINQLWQQTHPGIDLKWAGGQWAESALLAFYVDPHIRTVPGTPDDVAARVLDLPVDLPQQPGVLLCAVGWAHEPISEAGRVCEQEVQHWLSTQGWNPQALQGHTLDVQRPISWRFSNPRIYRYRVWMVSLGRAYGFYEKPLRNAPSRISSC